MKILVCGIPGVGKTTICQKLSELYNIKHYDVSKIIVEEEIYENKNKELDTYDFEIKKVRKYITKRMQVLPNYIIETHTPEAVKKIVFDHLFVLVIPLKELHKRLTERSYSEAKIQENIDCAIYNTIGYDCKEYFENVVYIGSDSKIYSVEETIKEIQHIIEADKK